MEVILLHDVENLGSAGEIVSVKPGFARNFLIPRGLGLRASKRNLAVSDERKRVSAARENRAAKQAQELAKKLSSIELTIEVQVGEEERLFGSVSSLDIHKALEEKKIMIERSAIQLEEPIKALGIYHIPVKINRDLVPEIKLYVIKA